MIKSRYTSIAPNHRDRWMVSYVDVLTILLVFFLVAAAKSLEPAPAAHAAPPLPPPPSQVAAPPSPNAAAPLSTKAAEMPVSVNLTHAEELLKAQGLEPKREPRGLVITLPQAILFASGDDAVSPAALPALAQIANVLREIPNEVRLIGHADTIPIHTRRFHSNWDLSAARCDRILELLSGPYGIPESRLSIASYGPYRPVAPNDTADGRASNRRVEILIVNE